MGTGHAHGMGYVADGPHQHENVLSFCRTRASLYEELLSPSHVSAVTRATKHHVHRDVKRSARRCDPAVTRITEPDDALQATQCDSEVHGLSVSHHSEHLS